MNQFFSSLEKTGIRQLGLSITYTDGEVSVCIDSACIGLSVQVVVTQAVIGPWGLCEPEKWNGQPHKSLGNYTEIEIKT